MVVIKNVNDYHGLNSRMDEMQAAFLTIKLKYIDKENQHRREVAQYYMDHIKNSKIVLPLTQNLKLETRNYLGHVWHLFVIRTSNRNDLQDYLTKNNIQSLIHYPIPPHKQLAYRFFNHFKYPITEKLSNEVLSLPIGSHISRKDLEYIVTIINKF